MRIITWNMRRANRKNEAWEYFLKMNPDLALLQEVSSIPNEVKKDYELIFEKATTKSGNKQKFGTAILGKGELYPKKLSSNIDGLNKLLSDFSGNLLVCSASIKDFQTLNVLSIYVPAWPIDHKNLSESDFQNLKLRNNSSLWGTELMWGSLIDRDNNNSWVVGGDLNTSLTFDYKKPRGNKEILDRMANLGFIELLYSQDNKLVPTYIHNNKKVIHQIDHLFVEKNLASLVKNCETGDENIVFSGSLSDHLPIIADFNL